MARWTFPVDPECPDVEKFHSTLFDDPMSGMVPGDVLGEIAGAWESKHQSQCERCKAYGAENTDIVY